MDQLGIVRWCVGAVCDNVGVHHDVASLRVPSVPDHLQAAGTLGTHCKFPGRTRLKLNLYHRSVFMQMHIIVPSKISGTILNFFKTSLYSELIACKITR